MSRRCWRASFPLFRVLVCAERHLAGVLAERTFGATVHLLDDGFQHLQLARDIDLLLLAPGDLREQVLPAGRLREPLATARLADAVLVTSPSAGPRSVNDDVDLGIAAVSAAIPHQQMFSVQMQPAALTSLTGAPANVSGRRAIAVAAIARPERFFDALRGLLAAGVDGGRSGPQGSDAAASGRSSDEGPGFEIVQTVTFRDHHWFTPADLATIARVARDSHADVIVTTEKDAVRLDAALLQGGTLDLVPWAVLPVVARVEPADKFTPWLLQQVAQARTRALARRSAEAA